MDRSTINLIAWVAFSGLVFFVNAIFVSGGGAAAVHAQIDPRALAVELTVHRPVPAQNASTSRDWREFQKAKYFGAFAYNTIDGSYGYVTDLPSVDEARRSALKTCASYSNAPSGCRLFAELRPAAELSLLPRRLSRSAETDFVRDYLPSVSALHEGAFAIDKQGSFGWSVELAIFGGAEEEALKQCELAVVEAKQSGQYDADYGPSSRCVLVHTK